MLQLIDMILAITVSFLMRYFVRIVCSVNVVLSMSVSTMQCRLYLPRGPGHSEPNGVLAGKYLLYFPYS